MNCLSEKPFVNNTKSGYRLKPYSICDRRHLHASGLLTQSLLLISLLYNAISDGKLSPAEATFSPFPGIRKGSRYDCLFEISGDPTRTRTWDPMVKSHLLYRLSYRTTRPILAEFKILHIRALYGKFHSNIHARVW